MSQHNPPAAVKKGRVVELEITDAAFEGKGFGKIDHFAVFVPNTAPGDLARVRIIRKRKQYAEGVLLELLRPSPNRISPRCTHATVCGGCTWQHIPYEQELRFKRQHVADHFRRIGGFTDLQPEPVIGAPDPYHYRNKMEYTFGDRRWLTDEEIQSGQDIADRDFALGLHIPGRFDRILDLRECHLQDPISYRILDAVRHHAIENGLEPWNTRQYTGYLRNLMIRNGIHTDDLMVNLVTSRYDEKRLLSLVSYLEDKFPEITTIINSINDTRSPTSEGRYRKIIRGPGYIHEHLGPFVYRIDPDTFFQTNTRQAEVLYDTVYRALDPAGVKLVYDLYCGVGTLSIHVSRRAEKVVGIEMNPHAIRKAGENALDNKTDNVFFEQGDMKEVFTAELTGKYGNPDVIITDPPRAGMHEQVINRIRELAPPRIVYVSCNSATQARDAALLKDLYHLERIQPVDMFPRTYHIESVAVLTLK